MTSSTTTRLRSHRLALVAAAIVVGLGACGTDDTANTADAPRTPASTSAPVATDAPSTTPSDDGPPVIEVAEAGGSSRGAASETAADSVAESDMDASTKMMATGIEFVFDGTAEDLTGPAVSWYFEPNQAPSDKVVADLAARFGVDGDVKALDQDRGGGLMVGADDFTGPSVSVSTDAMQSWWYSPGDSVAAQQVCEPVALPDGGENEAVECEPPPPPTNVPDEAQAEERSKELIDQLGLDPASYEFETYADDWGASASAFLVLDGVRTNVSMYFSYGAEGAITWAGGFLATPQRGPEYPRIGVEAAVERLNAPNWMGGGVVDPGLGTEQVPLEDTAAASDEIPDRAIDESIPDRAIDESIPVTGSETPREAPADTLGSPVLVDPVECDPAADCVPVDQEPIVVNLSNPRPALEQLWADDGTVWLLPGYAFDSDDQGVYTVIAIDASYLVTDEPEPTPEPAPDRDRGPAGTVEPIPAPEGPGTKGDGTDGTTGTGDADMPPSPETQLVGLAVDEAVKVAEEGGWEVRVVREDGQDLAVTDDFRTDRVNVAVADGVVTEVVSQG